MKLYFAGSEPSIELLKQQKSRYALFSYWGFLRGVKNKKTAIKRMQKFIDNNYNNIDLFMDSGGYSAYTCGAKIDINEYIDFCYKNKSKLIYAQLDDIIDTKQTIINLKYMEKEGLKPLPVFHYGADYKILQEMIKTYNYIALGGLVPYSRRRPLLIKHLDNCFSIVKNKIKIHGFGVTAIKILLRYPFYSVDSTSWKGGEQRAEYQKFTNGKMINKRVTELKNISFNNIHCMYKGKGDKSWRKRTLNNINEWNKVEKYITKVWEKRGIIWNE
tara:strand:+ start:12843 stop:13661 length:819 start_codon:yes stop_codon:yes gene_type:complete